MRKSRLLSSIRSRRTAFVLAMLMLVAAFPASANYEHYEEYKIAYESGGESCTQVMVTYRCTYDPQYGISMCEEIARNCVG
jgi:hypothetical protein